MRRERGSGSIYPRGDVWWIKYYKNGNPARESSGSTSKSRAKGLLRKRLQAVASAEPFRLGLEKIKVAELAKDFLQDYRINGLKSLDAQTRETHVLTGNESEPAESVPDPADSSFEGKQCSA